MDTLWKIGTGFMKQAEIIGWLEYWQNAKMVAVDQINAFDQVHLARKFCSCMRVGVFCPDLVTDLQIWRALQVMRGARPEWRETESFRSRWSKDGEGRWQKVSEERV